MHWHECGRAGRREGESVAELAILDDMLCHFHEGEDCSDLREASKLRAPLVVAY
ncbi:MAG: hypothetical protein ACI9DC_000870 [Gammaproteobacteria bacterium]|jgi:hypothetical protein